ncbi:hypothetical protein [Streptomyces sp. KR80]|uniref:hypothetical protein n=1 Tax=Streptomyces sp. KR80 TaxID=3457426 RepID=UPI003FD59542
MMGSVRSSRLTRLSCRAAVTVATVALCSTAALPAHADDVSPRSDVPGSAEGDSSTPSALPSRLSPTDFPFIDISATSTAPPYAKDGRDGEDVLGAETSSSSGSLKVTPSAVAAGHEVQIRVHGCKRDQDAQLTARSPAFVDDARLVSEGGSSFAAEAKIRSTTAPGEYRIKSDCGIEGMMTVIPGPGTAGASARADGGGNVALAAKAAQKEDGPGLVHVVVAAGLMTGAGVAVAGIALRRRRAGSAGD